ncbi:ricin-type beta-trefoil lectin domain protein [Umezawaea sp. Da 62-37]|uniref:ricin-type beta-trefoil lectin domain protein n=1 Tax=Umezawaea sp. Da 62-37 TaxID=3075927 RepID=UPI0028F70ECB|nr:ricin-type beta-trefoil lectin domain protein [Umezawaea sp. Da 62-37]WNV82951.1 ricin-type beta-trefoil lectin domain protein [Umezawaea sp. Da 62-37]
MSLLLASTIVVTAGSSPSSAATTRPTVTFANPTTQSTLGAAYTKALTNLLDVNTVRYDPAVYNQSGLMTNPPDTFIRAGGGYEQPWTRDAAVNSWNAASLLSPEVARNTLWSVVRRQSNGQLIVNQDNQWWDQVVWLTAAWNHYQVTGDRAFLGDAYQATTNTITARKNTNFNSTYGLFQGPSFFNDGIAGYPAPPADATESHGGFVGSYPTDKIMTLSTNTLYYSAYHSAALMASALGKPANEVSSLTSAADALKARINQYFWLPTKGSYGYLLHNGDGAPTGQLDESEEGTGLSFAILFGVADNDQARQIVRNAHVQLNGIVDVYPHFPRYSDTNPGRHNVSVWPMIQGYWAEASLRAGDQGRFASEVTTLATLANTGNGFYEIYNFRTGAPDGGWQGPNNHWGPLRDQTWSATAYLRMLYQGMLGMAFLDDGLAFGPNLPWGWGDVTVSGLRYRNATLNVTLRGAGSTIASYRLDGVTSSSRTIPKSLTGTHTVEIALTGGGAGPVHGYANQCLDNSQGNTADGNPVQIWGCNGTSAQQWAVGSGSTLHVSGKCLDVTSGGTANGTLVSLYDCNGTGAQVWLPQPNGALRNPQSGRCLDDVGASTTWGTQVAIWDCNGGANQNWFLPA